MLLLLPMLYKNGFYACTNVVQPEALCLPAACVCPSVSLSICPCVPTSLAHYIENQPFSVSAFWVRDECFNFWHLKVKVQSHGGVQHAGKSTKHFLPFNTMC